MNNVIDTIKQGIRDKRAYSFRKIIAEVKLNQNESPYDVPEALKREILKKAGELSWNRYPTINSEALRQALATYLDVPVDTVVVGAGSDELLGLAASVVLNKDTSVLTVQPTFEIYKQCAVTYEARQVELFLNKDLSYPVDAVLDVLRKQRINMFMFANPNNPTGSLLDLDILEDIAKASSGFVVVDEAYFEFSGITALPLQKKYRNIIITRTFSKACCLAGMRIGYIIADKDVAECMIKVKMPFSLNVFSEIAAMTLLQHPETIKQNVGNILENKGVLLEELGRIPALKVFPSAANFFIVDVGIPGTEAAAIFEKTGIAVRDVSHNPMLGNCIRVCVGTPEENRRLVEVMRSVVGK